MGASTAELRGEVREFINLAAVVRAGCSIPTAPLEQTLRVFMPQALAGAVVLPTGLGPDIWAELEVSRAEVAGVGAPAVVPAERAERVGLVK